MTGEKRKLFFLFLMGGLLGILGMYFYQNFNNEKNSAKTSEAFTIDQRTEEKLVIDFVKAHKKLPEYYITKKEAQRNGWIPSKGNLCDILPGKAIGGDLFSNREKSLPKGKYFEADVNYNCGNRNADRIIFNAFGDVWLTKNHYKNFEKQ